MNHPHRQTFSTGTSLEPGVNLIEASAGTGKTWSIVSIIAHQVAIEGRSLDQILVVSFTRAATAELRERVREGLVDLASHVESVISGEPIPNEPRANALITSMKASESGLKKGLQRLQVALAQFDQASILTIHGFCRQTLLGSTLESDLSPDLDLVQELGPVLTQLVDDYWVRELHDASLQQIAMLRDYKIQRSFLTSLAKRLESEPHLPIRMDLPPDLRNLEDPEPALFQQWEHAIHQLRQAWKIHGEEMTKWLLDAVAQKQLTGGNYNSQRPKRWSQALTEWLDRTDLDQYRYVPLPEYVSYFAGRRIRPCYAGSNPIPFSELHEAADRVCEASHARAERFVWGLVQELREKLPNIKEQAAILSYNDLLHCLHQALENPEHRQRLQARLRSRYSVALIDEFQDTDPIQWSVFYALFAEPFSEAHPIGILALVGDPKQSIYRFRGADMGAYVAAANEAGKRTFDLNTNYRSDPNLVHAVNQIFEPSGSFHHPNISYTPVLPCTGFSPQRIQTAEGAVSAMVLQIPNMTNVREEGGTKLVKSRNRIHIEASWIKDRLPHWVAEDVVKQLESNTQLWDDKTEQWIPLRPGHIAILMRSNDGVRSICKALKQKGVPAVSLSNESVWKSNASEAISQLLQALSTPKREGRARVLMTGPLVGLTGTDLEQLSDEEWSQWFERLIRWNERWCRYGFMSTFRQLCQELEVDTRLLRRPDGERWMTDLRHLAELIHSAERELGAKPERLTVWVEEQRNPDNESISDSGVQRLESDSDAVQVMTIHKSKGLEFPIVWCPDLFRPNHSDSSPLIRFTSPQAGNRRVLELSLNRELEPRPANQDRLWVETIQESIRLAYVAMTRAKHQCRVVCGCFFGLETSPLGNLLHAGPHMDSQADRFARVKNRILSQHPDDLRHDLEQIIDASSGQIGLETMTQPTGQRWKRPDTSQQAPLQIRKLHRSDFDLGWHRGSYSGLVKGKRKSFAVDSLQAEGIDHSDPGTEANAYQVALTQSTEKQLPLADFPKGAKAGTCLHTILEHHDFSDQRGLENVVNEHLLRQGFDPKLKDNLCTGLRQALRTPLGPMVGDLCLEQLRWRPRERLDELDFDLPVLGGTRAQSGAVGGRQLAHVLRQTREDCPLLNDDALERIASLPSSPLRGYLTGQIDLVFRVHGEQRWFIADYKSNWLGDPRSGSCNLQHYHPIHVQQNMDSSLYVLQYHLYTVALHRLLRWRLKDYDYDRHMGGSFYLYLRGMIGSMGPRGENGCPYGVFFDRPPRKRIEALDHLLAHGDAS